MTAIELTARPLTAEAFAPFGAVIAEAGAHHYPINGGTTERYHDLALVEIAGEGGRPLINIFVGRPFGLPVAITMMERHPLGSQAFVPLSGRPYLVVVAPGGPDGPAPPLAFLARGDQGVSYAAGTWHHPLLALEAEGRFLVIDRGGPGENLEERRYRGDGYLVAAVGPGVTITPTQPSPIKGEG